MRPAGTTAPVLTISASALLVSASAFFPSTSSFSELDRDGGVYKVGFDQYYFLPD